MSFNFDNDISQLLARLRRRGNYSNIMGHLHSLMEAEIKDSDQPSVGEMNDVVGTPPPITEHSLPNAGFTELY
ncbi:hypothetical protein KC19_VG095800 [Ceratodon purpureus]|uniref:Uncharacterized protein n=1 Tax=Ceratodon purpureus TaxID=3225 RepID=A0A8T0HNN4_CERPU|nr:hypothetical protein KC19_VG095800 [Ceratodon purpureus]